MIIRKLHVEQDGKIIAHFSLFSEATESKLNSKHSYFSLILGENGVGKSRFLKILQDIFLCVESSVSHEKTSLKRYDVPYDFEIEYSIGSSIILAHKEKKEPFVHFSVPDEFYSHDNSVLPTNVLAVSFMVSDKFLFTKNNKSVYKYLGVRTAANGTFTSSIFHIFTENLITAINDGKSKTVRSILKEIGFDDDFIEVTHGNTGKKGTLAYQTTYKAEGNSFFTTHQNDSILTGKTTASSISFKKKGQVVKFDDLSSGEKHLLFAMIGILRHINHNSIILIDEPEISLHPEWQNNYINKLKKYFSDYNDCHFIIASHSHYLVSDMPIDNSSVIVFRKNEMNYSMIDAEVIPYSTNAWSAENIIYNVFGMRTTRNYYFENDLNQLLSATENKNHLDIELADRMLKKLKKYVLSEADPLIPVLKEAEEIINVQS